jgi:hypothetical protein
MEEHKPTWCETEGIAERALLGETLERQHFPVLCALIYT